MITIFSIGHERIIMTIIAYPRNMDVGHTEVTHIMLQAHQNCNVHERRKHTVNQNRNLEAINRRSTQNLQRDREVTPVITHHLQNGGVLHFVSSEIQRTETRAHQSTKCQKMYAEVTPVITNCLQNGGVLHLMNGDIQRTETLPHQSTRCQKLYTEVTPVMTNRLQNGGVLHLVNGDVQRRETLPHQSTKCQKLYAEVTPVMTNRLQNGGIPGLERREGQGIINTGDLYKEVTRMITHCPQIGLYAELLFFMFYILYIYFFLVIFLKKFNFYGFYIAVAPRLNSI